MRRKLALWICPDLREEIAALQSGNTQCVHELDKLRELIRSMSSPMPEIGDSRRHLRGSFQLRQGQP